jgi:PAS domain S-box-containing protein
VDILLSPRRDEQGNVTHVVEAVRDVTDLITVEKELHDSKTYMESILKAAPVGIGLVHNRVFDWISDRMNEMLGYSEDELIGKSARVAYASDEEFERVGRDKYSEIQERGVGTVETRLRRKDGSVIDVLLGSSPVDPEDLSKGVIFTTLDITERKRAEESLRESEERHRLLLEASPDPIVVYDIEGKATYINPAFEQAFGWSSEELLDKRINFVPEENWPETRAAIDRMLVGERVLSFETRRLTKDGRVLDIQLSSSLFKDRDGKPVGNIVILRDVTEQKLAEQALRKREAELEIRASELEELNSALRVLLKRREEDQKELEEKVLSNVKELVLPYVERLKKSALGAKQGTYVNILESNLEDIVSPFVRKLSSTYLGLTPTEIHVANLVKEARDSKTIAELLNVSPRTVESHRQNIRKKLGLKNKKANLRSHLLSIQ